MAFDLEARRAARLAREKAVTDKLTPEVQAEISARATDAQELADLAEREDTLKALDIAKRFEAAEAAYPGRRVAAHELKALPDSFILVDPGSRAYRVYLDAMTDNVHAKRSNSEAHHTYAKQAIVDWNGQTDWNALGSDGKNTVGVLLEQFLRDNHAVAVSIAIATQKLAGATAEERKSAKG